MYRIASFYQTAKSGLFSDYLKIQLSLASRLLCRAGRHLGSTGSGNRPTGSSFSPKPTGMVLRSQTRTGRSVVRANIHRERPEVAIRPEPETEFAPVVGPSSYFTAIETSSSPSTRLTQSQKPCRNIHFQPDRNRK